VRFADRFGAGSTFDVVLNSLAGEFIDASLDLLPTAAGSWRWARPTSATRTAAAGDPPAASGYHVYDIRAMTHAETGVRGRTPTGCSEIH